MVEGGCGSFAEGGFQDSAFFFDVEVGDFEVLAEELEGEAEEGLVLGLSEGCERGSKRRSAYEY